MTMGNSYAKTPNEYIYEWMNEYIYINQYKDNIKSSKSALIMYSNQLLDFPERTLES